jgi:GPH family glycoside/pentoside/hexuronide:cation symporter
MEPKGDMREDQTAPSATGGLSKFTIFSYGLPRFGNALMYLAIAIYFPKFVADTLLLDAAYIGWIFLLGRCWDGVTDPLMGYISDRTKWSMGRRRPYFLIGAIPLAAAFSLLWSPPGNLEGISLVVYLAVTFMLTYTFWTVFSVPYTSLGAELTMDYHERTVLTGVREVFGVLGTIAATMLLFPTVVERMFGNLRTGYSNLAMMMGAITATLIFIAFFSLRENPEFQRRQAVPLVEGLRVVFQNRPFRRLLLVFVIHLIGGYFVPMLTLFMQDYVIKVKIAQWIILTYLVFTILSIPFWTRLSRRLGKKETWSYALAYIVVVALISFYYHEGTWVMWYVCAAAAGFGAGAAAAIAPSMMADVIDYDELKTGSRREGAYFGLWAFIDKVAVGMTAFIGFGILGLMGYEANAEQTPMVWWSMKFLYSILPAICNGASYFLLKSYPIDQAEHERIRAEIEAKKSAAVTETG